MRAEEIRDVHTLDDVRRFGQTERGGQFGDTPLRVLAPHLGTLPHEMVLRHLLERVDRVAQARGLREVLRAGGGLHLLDKLRDHLRTLPPQERTRLVEARMVVGHGDATLAGGRAVANHIRMAMAVRLLIRHQHLAPTQPPALLDEVLGRPDDRRRGERPEIQRAVIADNPAGAKRGKRFLGIRTQRKVALVVPHEDVELRLVPLDEVRLGEQCLRVVAHRHELKIRDRVHHRADLRRMLRARAEIRQNASTQVLRLADVDDDAPAIPHQVTAGAVWNGLEPLSQNIVHLGFVVLALRRTLLPGGLLLLLLVVVIVIVVLRTGDALAFLRALLELALRLAQRTSKLRNLLRTTKKHKNEDRHNQNLPRAPCHNVSSFLL